MKDNEFLWLIEKWFEYHKVMTQDNYLMLKEVKEKWRI